MARRPASSSSSLWGAMMNYMGFDSPSPRRTRAKPVPNAIQNPNSSFTSTKFDFDSGSQSPQWLALERYGVPSQDDTGVPPPLAGVVLSLWDNLSGPRVVHAWHALGVDQAALTLTAPYTLNGEMLDASLEGETKNGTARGDRVEPKLLLLNEYGVGCLLFCAKHRGSLARFSLSLVLSHHVMPRYPSLAPILHDRMLQVVELYRRAASLELPPSAILHALDALAARIFPQIHKLLDVSTIVAPVPFNRSLLAQHPTFTPNLRLLVARALTAQLQCGSIVVLGSDPANVISWVCFLAQFVVESQRHVACVKVRHGIESYVPDLALQGIVCAKGASLDAEALVQGLRPVAVVDLHQHRVLSAHAPHKYVVLRQDYHEQLRRRLLREAAPPPPALNPASNPVPPLRSSGGISNQPSSSSLQHPQRVPLASTRTKATPAPSWDTEPLLQELLTPSPLLQRLVERLLLLPPTPLYMRQAACSQVLNLLVHKALLIVSYTEALLDAAYTTPASLTSSTGAPLTNSTPPLGATPTHDAREMTPTVSHSTSPVMPHSRRRRARLAQLYTQHVQSSHVNHPLSFSTPGSQSSVGIPIGTSSHSSTHYSSASGGGEENEEGTPATPAAPSLENLLDPRETRRRLKFDLSLTDNDLFPLLGLADHLQPGTFAAVAGNPAWIEEKLVRQILPTLLD